MTLLRAERRCMGREVGVTLQIASFAVFQRAETLMPLQRATAGRDVQYFRSDFLQKFVVSWLALQKSHT